MVDPLMAVHTGDLILRLKEKFHKTSVVVTHDTHLAKKLADRIVFLHEGRVGLFWPVGRIRGRARTLPPQFHPARRTCPELDIVPRVERRGLRSLPALPKVAAGDGVLGRAAVLHHHGAGAAVDRGGGAQRAVFDQLVDSCGGVVFADRVRGCGTIDAISGRGQTTSGRKWRWGFSRVCRGIAISAASF